MYALLHNARHVPLLSFFKAVLFPNMMFSNVFGEQKVQKQDYQLLE
jgi:hypothetical protein